ncbi:dethiobiotin synthase [Clostridium niameyense]|uniref:dethiobiotin synthase n=1 Tax=Clostridium niameyense TaxID=1622073 RepID=UPI00067E7993|nr:dethiobiotin synthase [Clostridium niameyense]
MTKGIFITGTDTEVGKTVVTAGLMYLLRSRGYNATYFKAALSGYSKSKDKIICDASFVREVSELQESLENITPYMYETAVSPHLAGNIENNPINIEKVKEKYNYLKKKYDYIIAEGSGGIICPLIDNEHGVYLLEDLIKDLNMDVIVVARAGVGTINHTILTIKYIKSLGIKVKGIIINGYENSLACNDNINMIKKLIDIQILAVVNFINEEKLDIKSLKKEMNKAINVDILIKAMNNIY